MSVPEPLSGLIGGAVLKAGAFSVGLSPTKLGKWENQAGVSRIVQYHSNIIRYIDFFLVLIWNSGKIRVSGMIFCFPLIWRQSWGKSPFKSPETVAMWQPHFEPRAMTCENWFRMIPGDHTGDSLSIWMEHYWFNCACIMIYWWISTNQRITSLLSK